MYKIYFDNRFITLSSEPDRLQKYDLFHKFINTVELYNLISGFQAGEGVQSINIYSGNIKHLWKIFRIYFSEIPAAGGFVRHSGGRYLFIEKRGRFDIPKGHVEPGESTESCAVREVAEECGLSGHYIIRPLRTTFHTYTAEGISYLKRNSWFLMGYDGDMTAKPQAEEGITNIRWLLPDEFGSLKNSIWPSLADVLNPFIANVQNLW